MVLAQDLSGCIKLWVRAVGISMVHWTYKISAQDGSQMFVVRRLFLSGWLLIGLAFAYQLAYPRMSHPRESVSETRASAAVPFVT